MKKKNNTASTDNISTFDQIKKTEKALRHSEEKLSAILDSMPDLVLQLDTKLKILWANKATLKLNPKAVGQLCYKALPSRNIPCPDCPIIKALKTGQIEQGIVHLLSVKGVGESYWDDIGIPVKDTQGKITSIVKIARNITEKKKAEEAILKKNKELETFNKIAVGREIKMIELKKEINTMLKQAGKKPKYKIAGENEQEAKE